EELETMLDAHELVVVSRALATSPRGDAAELAFSPRRGGAVSARVLGTAAGSDAKQVFASWPSYFADGDRAVQEWFDALPAVVEGVEVLRDLGYSAAPWTLSAAPTDPVLRAGGRAVRIFDFSSLDPRAPERPILDTKSAHLNAIAPLAELRARHAKELLEAG